tara:strand:+ start:7741 stop:8169 length:429 start_codon:yes stop_codon:yes gene_type:complete
MSHYAEIDESNKVVRVIVAEQDFIDSGAVGDKNNWIQTSYNTKQGVHYATAANGSYVPDGGTALRGNYAGVGYDYVKSMDAFVAPLSNTAWTSWTINTKNFTYESPLGDAPTDANTTAGEYYEWDENAYKANNQTGWILKTP